jgi:hypothetical protein
MQPEEIRDRRFHELRVIHWQGREGPLTAHRALSEQVVAAGRGVSGARVARAPSEMTIDD